jgi:hypothetical protein
MLFPADSERGEKEASIHKNKRKRDTSFNIDPHEIDRKIRKNLQARGYGLDIFIYIYNSRERESLAVRRGGRKFGIC